MKRKTVSLGTARAVLGLLAAGAILWHPATLSAQQPPTSYSPVVMQEDFGKTVARMSAAKPQVMQRHMKLLEERYDWATGRLKASACRAARPFKRASA